MVKIKSRCGRGVKGKTVFYSSQLWVKQGLAMVCSGQNRESKLRTCPSAQSKLLHFFLLWSGPRQFYAPSISKSHMMAPFPLVWAAGPDGAAPGPPQGC